MDNYHNFSPSIIIDCYKSNNQELIKYINNFKNSTGFLYRELACIKYSFYTRALVGAFLGNNMELVDYFIVNKASEINLTECLQLLCELGSIENIEYILKIDPNISIDDICLIRSSGRRCIKALKLLKQLIILYDKQIDNNVYYRMFKNACLVGNINIVIYILENVILSDMMYVYKTRTDDEDDDEYIITRNSKIILSALYGENPQRSKCTYKT